MMLCSETDWLCHLSYWRLWQVVMASVRCVIELQQKQVAIRMSSLDAQITFVCLSVYSSLQLGCVCVCETELHLVSVEKSFIIDFSFFFSSSLAQPAAPQYLPANLSSLLFALSVDDHRALYLFPPPSTVPSSPSFVVPSSPKASRDEQTNRRLWER